MPAVAAKPQVSISRLGGVQRGRLKATLRYVFYGDNGVGKSTLAAHAPKPIWFDIEDGSGRLDVDRYPFRDGPGGHVPTKYSEVLAALDDLTTHPHDYQTLVVDTTDRLEALMWAHMCERDRKDSIEGYGYGKGYVAALDEWRKFCLTLDRLRSQRSMSIVLIAHSQIRTFKAPVGDDFDRYQLRIHDKAAGFIKEWADVVGFVAFEEGASKMGNSDRAKGYSTGKRLIFLERTAAYDAKTRIVLPTQIEMDANDPWAPLATAVDDGVNLSAKELRTLISSEVTRIAADADLSGKVAEAVKQAKEDVEALSRILNRLKVRPTKAAE